MFSNMSRPRFEVAIRQDYEELKDEEYSAANGNILKQIQNMAANVPQKSISGRSKLNFIIRIVFDVYELHKTDFERFFKQMKDVVGAMQELLNYGSVFMSYESLASKSAGITFEKSSEESKGIGGDSGFPIQGWNRRTLKKLYGILTDEEPEEEPNDRKFAISSEMSFPRIYKIFYALKKDTQALKDYDYRFIGYDDANTFNKIVYIYLIPKNTSSKYGTFEEMVKWLNNNIIDKTTPYDDYEILNNSSRVTIEVKISCDGYKPVRTDGKKELKFEQERPSGLVWKYLFYDGDWDRFGQGKRGGRMFTNGMLNTLSGNSQFKRDVENGYFGKYAQQHADEETKIK